MRDRLACEPAGSVGQRAVLQALDNGHLQGMAVGAVLGVPDRPHGAAGRVGLMAGHTLPRPLAGELPRQVRGMLRRQRQVDLVVELHRPLIRDPVAPQGKFRVAGEIGDLFDRIRRFSVVARILVGVAADAVAVRHSRQQRFAAVLGMTAGAACRGDHRVVPRPLMALSAGCVRHGAPLTAGGQQPGKRLEAVGVTPDAVVLIHLVGDGNRTRLMGRLVARHGAVGDEPEGGEQGRPAGQAGQPVQPARTPEIVQLQRLGEPFRIMRNRRHASATTAPPGTGRSANQVRVWYQEMGPDGTVVREVVRATLRTQIPAVGTPEGVTTVIVF